MSLAFVFPGQGSQTLGMGTELAHGYPFVTDIFRQASDVLGYDLLALITSGPEEVLNKTENTQPALLTASYAVWRVWQEKQGPMPVLMAGHSLGEYTALVCAGALEFTDAVSLVADRGRFMQAAVPEGVGAMAAILGLDDAVVNALCEDATNETGSVAAANYNSTGQVVIAGHTDAVNRALEAAADAGARRSILLPVSVPSHCTLMRPAADKLAEKLAAVELRSSGIPVLHNVDMQSKATADDMRQALVDQLTQPVRWVGTINSMTEQGITRIVECGPGKVLCGLIKRVNRQIETLPVYDSPSIDTALAALGE